MTERAPCSLRVGLTVISTSWRRAVRNSIKRPTKKLPARFRISDGYVAAVPWDGRLSL